VDGSILQKQRRDLGAQFLSSSEPRESRYLRDLRRSIVSPAIQELDRKVMGRAVNGRVAVRAEEDEVLDVVDVDEEIVPIAGPTGPVRGPADHMGQLTDRNRSTGCRLDY
jgi:hypothetical protein